MLTVKDIQDVRFTKVLGGYKTEEVDTFLDQCAETIEYMTTRIDENENKMQVLAETIVEYRNQEDSIRAALISAQRMADSVMAEAQEKAAAIVAQAQQQADAIAAESAADAASAREKTLLDIEAEHNELRRVRQEVAAFKARLMSIYREHLTLIGVLEDTQDPAVEAETAVETPAQEPLPMEEEPELAPATQTPAFTQPVYTGSMPDFSAFELKEEE